MQNSSYIDSELGEIEIVTSRRSMRRITMKPTANGVRVTCPLITPLHFIKETIEKYRAGLLEMKLRMANRSIYIDASFTIKTDCFTLRLEPHGGKAFQIRVEIGEGILLYPEDETFAPERQEWLHKAIVQVLRAEAKLYLPVLLRDLAQKHGFSYSGVTIKDNHSNWGSCSIKKHINLSLYLMTLPKHLIEYVLVHELCHTVEMNHSERFWALVDRCLGSDSRKLRSELRNYHTTLVS